jgi:hypothetical protein
MNTTLATQFLYSRFRWIGTFGLECFLGILFLTNPQLTLRILGAENTASMAAMFQLYGAVILHRGLVQQILYSRRDLALFRHFLLASLPFSIGSAVVLSQTILAGLMNQLVGWLVVMTFVVEVIDNVALYYLTKSE